MRPFEPSHAPAHWDDDADDTPVRAAPSHVRMKRAPLKDPPASLPKLPPVLELPPELLASGERRADRLPVGKRPPLRPPLAKRRVTQPLPLMQRWSAATVALPLVHKSELHLSVRRVRARRAWAIAWAAALVAGAITVAGWWLVRPNMASSMELGVLARASQAAAESGYGAVVIDGPEGVKVALDGIDHGRLPLSINALRPGRHTLELDGRPAGSVLVREIELSGGEVLELGELEL